MARSRHIYAVMLPDQPAPVMAFTVKHELRDALDGMRRSDPVVRKMVRVFRLHDGLVAAPAVELSDEEIQTGR